MSKIHDGSRPPGYYIKKRLLRNKPAMFGLGFIVISLIISIFGYLIMPDQTPDTNDGAVQIQKQPPGFTVTFIKIRKNRVIEQRNLFERALFGQEGEFMIVPIMDYQIEHLYVRARIFGKSNYYKEYNMLDAVKQIQSGTVQVSDSLARNTKYTFKSLQGETEEISQLDLLTEFEANNLEERTYWLGTDRMGRDMLSRLLFGTRISLSIGFLAVLISMFLGMSLGSIAGFFGGKTDMFVMWFMSVIWSIPGIILVIAISMALQSRGVWVAFVAVGLTMW
jgi:peptide/nickel transport system permease protein